MVRLMFENIIYLINSFLFINFYFFYRKLIKLNIKLTQEIKKTLCNSYNNGILYNFLKSLDLLFLKVVKCSDNNGHMFSVAKLKKHQQPSDTFRTHEFI